MQWDRSDLIEIKSWTKNMRQDMDISETGAEFGLTLGLHVLSLFSLRTKSIFLNIILHTFS